MGGGIRLAEGVLAGRFFASGPCLGSRFPFPSNFWISFNISPETLVARELRATLDSAPGGRVVLEVTEHAVIREYDTLTVACEELRASGFRLAVDDAGAGYASLRHILKLKPEFIKLDASLIRDVDSDPARRALASAMVDFGRKLGSELIAEGVETEAELETVERLGIDMAQGYRLGRPASLAGAPPFVAWCRAA